jgi:type I restriction enzyme S subunit
MSSSASIEYREINLRDIERFRFDAEFYQNDYLALNANLLGSKTECLGDIAIIRSGTTPRDRDDELIEGVNLLKTNDIRNVPLLKSRTYYKISQETADTMSSTKLEPKDILINIVGATLDVVGRVAFIPEDFEETNITQAMALIRVQDERFLPEYVFAFMLHSNGNQQARRLARPTGQYNLNLPEVSAIRIPLIPIDKQRLFALKLMEVEQGYKDADSVLNSASDLLAREIGFIDFEWNNEKISIRDSLSVLAERRIDSEYWQIGFDEILEKLVKYKNGFSKLEDKFKQAKKTFKASDLAEYQYIEISDIDVRSGEISPNSVQAQELPANAKIELLNRSLLISKVRPNRGAIAIAEGLDGAVVSGALVTLTPIADMNLETLMTYLRLEPIREFILKFNTGTSYPTITDEVVMHLPVPNIPSDLQSQLSELINRSKLLHRTAKNSLKNLVDSI